MKCFLLSFTPNLVQTIASSASLCYSADDIPDIMNAMPANKADNLIKHLIFSGHMSPLEHGSITFGIQDVSRALTHQLVRHRLASFSQQSMRYVAMDNNRDFVTPPSCLDSGPREMIFQSSMAAAFSCYQMLIDEGVPAEDARYVLPNGWHTKIVVTMNCRELFHFFELRLCCRAQWEIRNLAQAMFNHCYGLAPQIFKYAGTPCITGACHEEHPCETPYLDFEDMLTRDHEKINSSQNKI